jgi:hypothetical protein
MMMKLSVMHMDAGVTAMLRASGMHSSQHKQLEDLQPAMPHSKTPQAVSTPYM